MRITTVKKARIDQGNCEFCRNAITAGMSYMFISPRYGGKRKRHAECRSWKPSEMTSGKSSTALAAQEDAHDELETISWPVGDEDPVAAVEEAVKAALENASEGARECQEDYQEGLDNMPEGLQYGPVGEGIQENIDALEAWIDELEGWTNSEGTPEVAGDACKVCGLSYTDGDHETEDDGRFSADGHYFEELVETVQDDDWVIDVLESAKEAVDSLELF